MHKYIFLFDQGHECHGRFQIVYAKDIRAARDIMSQNYTGGWHGYSYQHWLEVNSFPTEFPLERILFEDCAEAEAQSTSETYEDVF